MKWIVRSLAALGAILIVCVAVLVVLGTLPGAGSFHSTKEIAKSPDRVWVYLTEADKVKKWVSWLVEVREPSPTEHVWVMEDQNNGGKKMTIDAKIVESTPPKIRKVHTSVPETFSGDQSYELIDLGGNRTRLEIHGVYKFSNWFANLMQPLVMRSVEKKMQKDLAQLKLLVETSNP